MFDWVRGHSCKWFNQLEEKSLRALGKVNRLEGKANDLLGSYMDTGVSSNHAYRRIQVMRAAQWKMEGKYRRASEEMSERTVNVDYALENANRLDRHQ